MMDSTSMTSNGTNGGSTNGSSLLPSAASAAAAFNVHQQLAEASRLFQQNSFQANSGVVSPFGNHLAGLADHVSVRDWINECTHQHHSGQHLAGTSQGQNHPHSAAAAAINAMGPPHGMGQLPHGLTGPSQQIAAALFANSPLISDDLKLAAAAAAAAAAAQSARGKKTHRAEPVPQSGFKGVSWNSRMKAWLAFYVTENGERKSKTFSTRKLGMEEARLQAITFCKQKQDQRREARKRNREMQNQQHTGDLGVPSGNTPSGLDKLSSDESMMDSPASGLGHLIPNNGQGNPTSGGGSSSSTQLRCAGYPTTPGMGLGGLSQSPTQVAAASNGSEIAYVPIVPIALDMIEKSGLLQPLELNVLPPCQHCNKQPYPFLMIVSEGQEQTYSGSSIMSLASHGQTGGAIPGQSQPCDDTSPHSQSLSGVSASHNQLQGCESSSPTTPVSDQSAASLAAGVSSNDPTSHMDGVEAQMCGEVKMPEEEGTTNNATGNLNNTYMSVLQCKRQGEDDGDHNNDENGSSSGGQSGRTTDLHHLHHHHVESQYNLRSSRQPQQQQTTTCAPSSASDPNPMVFDPQSAVGALLGITDPVMGQHLQHLSHQLGLAAAGDPTALALNQQTAALLRLPSVEQQRSLADHSSRMEDEDTTAGINHHHHQQVIDNLRAAGYSTTDATTAANQLLGLTTGMIDDNDDVNGNSHDDDDDEGNLGDGHDDDDDENNAESISTSGMLASI